MGVDGELSDLLTGLLTNSINVSAGGHVGLLTQLDKGDQVSVVGCVN